MIIPANFVAGALVGAVSTYVFKDDTSRTWLKDTGNKLKKGGSSVIGKFKKKKADDSETAKNGEVIEGVAEEVVAKEKEAEKTTESVKESKEKAAS